MSGKDIATVAQDIERHAISLLETSPPETAIGRILDVFLPDAIRKEKQRGERDLVAAEIRSQVRIHETVKAAQERQINAIADAFGRACELEAEEAVGIRAVQVAARMGSFMRQTGAEFDRDIDAEIADAKTLNSVTALTARADRLQRDVNLRAGVEEEVRENILGAVRSARRHP
jgi:hypothetical protein